MLLHYRVMLPWRNSFIFFSLKVPFAEKVGKITKRTGNLSIKSSIFGKLFLDFYSIKLRWIEFSILNFKFKDSAIVNFKLFPKKFASNTRYRSAVCNNKHCIKRLFSQIIKFLQNTLFENVIFFSFWKRIFVALSQFNKFRIFLL